MFSVVSFVGLHTVRLPISVLPPPLPLLMLVLRVEVPLSSVFAIFVFFVCVHLLLPSQVDQSVVVKERGDGLSESALEYLIAELVIL